MFVLVLKKIATSTGSPWIRIRIRRRSQSWGRNDEQVWILRFPIKWTSYLNFIPKVPEALKNFNMKVLLVLFVANTPLFKVAGVYFLYMKTIFIPTLSENEIFSPSRDTLFFLILSCPFCLNSSYFAFTLLFYFPFSLSFPFLAFSFILSPFSLSLFIFFLQMTSLDISW